MDFLRGPLPRIRKTVGILVLVTGIGMFVGAFLFHRYLVQTSPTVSTPLTGQIVQEGKGSPHYFVTTDEDQPRGHALRLGICCRCLRRNALCERTHSTGTAC
jgi:hypothetical protein